MTVFKRIVFDLIGLLFPEICLTCGNTLVRGETNICISCLRDLPFTDFHLDPNNRVAKQLWGRLPCSAAMAMLFFKKGGKVQSLMHALKYRNQTQIAFQLGLMLGDRLLLSGRYASVDAIIPVPLHKKKQRSRGYNQSDFIADGIALRLQVPVIKGLLIKKTATASQTRKNRFSRYENLKSVFEIEAASRLEGLHILLVDDVITTGATLEACGLVLYAAGIKSLSIAALAFTD